VFSGFFLGLRAAGAPVSLREYLTLLEALSAGLARFDVEAFYHLSRAALIKDERHFDKFDRVFAEAFKGVEAVGGAEGVAARPIPEDWLRKLAEKHLTEEEKRLVESLGGWDALMETLRCLKCQSQSIHDSDAPMAGDMRHQVRSRIAAGESPDEVRAWLVERYGDYVTYRPGFDAATWPLFALPVLFILLAGVVLVRRLGRRGE